MFRYLRLLIDGWTVTFSSPPVFLNIKETSDCIFVSRRGDPENYGGLPGGKIEAGEREEDAAVREFKEETGLECNLILPSVLTRLNSSTDCTVHVFLATADIKENEWINPEGDVCRKLHWTNLLSNRCVFSDFYNNFLKDLLDDNPKYFLIEKGFEKFVKELESLFEQGSK